MLDIGTLLPGSRRERRHRVDRTVMDETGGIVRAGPFTGLRYPFSKATGSALSPKLLGTYEVEIHAFVERAIRQRPARVINIGAGEGYYAVGLALRLPDAEVYAFEAQQSGRDLTVELASANGVSHRVHVAGACGIAELRALTADPALIVCDVEGAERELLDPSSVPGLARCEIIAELHRIETDDLVSEIGNRFAGTHRLGLAHYDRHSARRAARVIWMSEGDQKVAVDERRRHGLDWVHLIPLGEVDNT